MHDFQYHQDELCCEEVPLRKLPEKWNTFLSLQLEHAGEPLPRLSERLFQSGPSDLLFGQSQFQHRHPPDFHPYGAGRCGLRRGDLPGHESRRQPNRIVYSGVGKRKRRLSMPRTSHSDVQRGIDSGTGPDGPDCRKDEDQDSRGPAVNPDVDPKTHPIFPPV